MKKVLIKDVVREVGVLVIMVLYILNYNDSCFFVIMIKNVYVVLECLGYVFNKYVK